MNPLPLDDDARFDARLRAAFAQDPAPADGDGFAARLLQALPAQQRRSPRAASNPWPARLAIGMAMGLGAAWLAVLPGQGLTPLEQGLASSCLVALLLWWSMPQSRGSLWH